MSCSFHLSKDSNPKKSDHDTGAPSVNLNFDIFFCLDQKMLSCIALTRYNSFYHRNIYLYCCFLC